jgi:hypothetical protein
MMRYSISELSMKDVTNNLATNRQHGYLSEPQRSFELLRIVLKIQTEIIALHRDVQALTQSRSIDTQKLDGLQDAIDTLIRDIDVYRHG